MALNKTQVEELCLQAAVDKHKDSITVINIYSDSVSVLILVFYCYSEKNSYKDTNTQQHEVT